MTTNYIYSPKELLNLALIQVELFTLCLRVGNPPIQIASLYNLRFAVELALKGYLIFLNKSYATENNLKRLSHDISKTAKLITKYDQKIGMKLENLFKEYKFLTINSDELRYFKVGDVVTVNYSYNELITVINELKELVD